ncbi:DNA gyrase subunit B [Enterobacteriales bacterium SAP-6]|uniref:DNA gyrase subunit B n=1 Tax=Acerihabitans arboris TaxID=2691583 RepID=A0A845SSF9_9GAMM|nr:DNA gyrase subunit B [Acerihabitans arboris]
MAVPARTLALRAARLFSLAVITLYPFAVWYGITHGRPDRVALALAGIFLLRLLVFRGLLPALNWLAKALALFGILLCAASWLLKSHHLLLWYPVMMSGLMLALFSASLFSRASMVERLARLREPWLSPRAIAYTRRVTQAWCLFFIINGGAALFTCLYGDMSLWALYNGVISYLLMGLLMGTEWIIRKRIQPGG